MLPLNVVDIYTLNVVGGGHFRASDYRTRGIGYRFDCVVENTLGKDATTVKCLTRVPVHAQELVGAW